MKRLVLALALWLCAAVASALPVIPGAPALAGMDTRAAYACGPTNPTIYHITTLADSGAGSFREALEASGPRVAIFERSGYITLLSTLTISNPCLTIAGQTAPSPGITIRGGGSVPTDTSIYINTHDVLWQHMAIRPGDSTCNSGLQLYGGSQQNVVLDHLSFSWGQDENIAFDWTLGQSTDAVVWRSILAEGLFQASGGGGCSGGGTSNGHGILVGASAKRISVVQSLYASNYERNPYMQGDTNTVLINNVTYQPHGPWGFFYNNGSVCGIGCGSNDPWYSSAVGNRYIKGPHTCCTGGGDDTVSYVFLYSQHGGDSPDIAGNKIYRSDNTIANQDGTITLELNQYGYDPNVGSAPTEAPMPSGFTPLASTAVEAFVLANAGARPQDRDATDTRIIATVTNRNGNYVSSPTDVGGYPTLATNSRTLTEPGSPHTVTGSGYTNLEIWLQGYASALESAITVPRVTGSKFVTDTFTGTTGTDLVTGHTGELGAVWAYQTGSSGALVLTNDNQLRQNSIATGANVYASGLPLTSQYDLDLALTKRATTTNSIYSLWARMSTGAVSGYLLQLSMVDNTLSLIAYNAGTPTTLVSTGVTVGTGAHTLTFKVRDTSISAEYDGTQVIYSTDTSITGTGRVGLAMYAVSTGDSNTTGIAYDRFDATDFTTAVGPPTLLYRLRTFRGVHP